MSNSNAVTTQAVIVTDQAAVNHNQVVQRIAFFDEAGVIRSDLGADATAGPVVTGSAIGTVAKSTTAAEPSAGQIVHVKFTNGNSATSPTLAFAGGAARAMQLGGTASAAAKLVIAAGGIAQFYFDGTILHQIGTYT